MAGIKCVQKNKICWRDESNQQLFVMKKDNTVNLLKREK